MKSCVKCHTREAHGDDMACTCHLASNGTRKCAVHS